MRIAFISAPSQNKKVLVDAFLDNWSSYKLVRTEYDVEKELTPENQLEFATRAHKAIVNEPVDSNKLYVGTVLDSLIYSLWAHERGVEGFDEAFIGKIVPLVVDASRYMDIYYFIPITKVAPVQTNQPTREEVITNIRELDCIYKATAQASLNPKFWAFDPENRPPILEIFGNTHERIEMLKLYISAEGGLYDSPNTVFSPENLDLMEKVLREQREVQEIEQLEEKVKNSVSIFSEKDFKAETKKKS